MIWLKEDELHAERKEVESALAARLDLLSDKIKTFQTRNTELTSRIREARAERKIIRKEYKKAKVR